MSEFAEAILEGCTSSASSDLKVLFFLLYPATFRIRGPLNLKMFVPFEWDGVPLCLRYGYHKTGEDSDSEPDTSDALPRLPVCGGDDKEVASEDARRTKDEVNRGRVRKRIILAKKTGKQGRARSPERKVVDLRRCVVDVKNAQRPYRIRSIEYLLDHHDDFFVKSEEYFQYFEPQRPDLICFQKMERREVLVKLVCEIGSWDEEGIEGVSLEQLVTDSTEQCVRSALASLSHNQEFICGLVLVVDGMKLIQIKKDSTCYRIRETPLVLWHEERKLFVLLEMIRQAIMHPIP